MGDWNDILQFQSTDDSGGWIYFGVDDTTGTPRLYMDSPTGHVTLATPHHDHWYHFAFDALWSTDPRTGPMQVWLDGNQVVPEAQTLKNQTNPANSNSTSPGMYLSEAFTAARATSRTP